MLSQTKSNHSNLSNSREVVRNISEVIGRFGVRVVPFRSPDLTHFRLLTEARQRLAIQQAMSYSESLDMVVREGWSLNDEKRALWSALRFFGFRPNSDVFSFIKDGDSVELYNSEHIQLWRNLGFMKICSYSLEEMFCFPWGERYIRDEVSLNTALETIGKLLQGRTRETIHLNLRNILVETFSEEKFCYRRRP